MTGWGMRAHRGDGETLWDMKWESETDIELDKTGKKRDRLQTEWKVQKKKDEYSSNGKRSWWWCSTEFAMRRAVKWSIGAFTARDDSTKKPLSLFIVAFLSSVFPCSSFFLPSHLCLLSTFTSKVFTSHGLLMPLWELLNCTTGKKTVFLGSVLRDRLSSEKQWGWEKKG